MPVDSLKLIQKFTFSESGGTPPWRRAITNSSVLLSVGELLSLNVDAFDPNENDDVDIGFASLTHLPSSAGLGPRQCCTDDFSSCEYRPFNYTNNVNVNTTSCATNTNLEPGAALQPVVMSTCKTTCVLQALPMPCRAGQRERSHPLPRTLLRAAP